MPVTRTLSKSHFLDVLAMGLSGLCVAHCLLMPLVFAVLPFLGVFSENHLVHQGLVLLAAPIGVFALVRSGGWRLPSRVMLALSGLGLLAAAAFYRPFEAYETPLTVMGASLLALMHLINLRHSHVH